MNVSSGGLSFDFTATNDNLITIIEQSKKEIQTLADTSRAGGRIMDSAFRQAAERLDGHTRQVTNDLNSQKQAVAALEKELEKLRTQAAQQNASGDQSAYQATMALIRAKELELQKRRECITACNDGLTVLAQESQRLEQLQQASQTAATAQMSLRGQLRQVREQLAEMEANQGVGVRQTEQFRALQAEAGRLADALGDAQTQVAVFSDDNAMITGTLEGLNGLAGGFSAVQGTMALFGVESDKVQQAMLKVQSLMAITTGLQQAANALNKDSAFQLIVVRKAKDLLAASTNKLSVALGVSTAAAKALMATLTLGLSIAITGLIWLWNKYSDSTKEAAKETTATQKAFEEFHSSTAKKSAELVSKYEQLRDSYSKLKTTAEKTKWIKDNASAMDSLGLAVDGVTSADNIFVRNTDKVIKALELRAQAMGLQELQMKAFEEYYSKIINADNTIAGGGYYTPTTGIISRNSEEAKAVMEAMRKAGAVNENGILTNDGSWYTMSGGNMKLTKKSIDAVNEYLRQQARATNQKVREDAKADLDKTVNAVKSEMAKTQKEIDKLGVLKPEGSTDKTTGKSSGEKKTEAQRYAEELAKKKALYQEYLEWKTSSDASVSAIADKEFADLMKGGHTYLDYLQKQQEALAAVAPTEEVKAKLRMVQAEIAEATKESTLTDFRKQLEADLKACTTLGAMLDLIEERRQKIAGDDTEVGNKERDMLKEAEESTKAQIKSETAQLLTTYASYEAERLKFMAEYAKNRQLLERRITDASTEEERRGAEAALAALEKKNASYTKATTGTYAALLEEYKSHQQQLTEIQEKYATQRAEATANGNISMLRMIDRKEQEEISQLAAAQLMASESWNQLFSNIERLGTGAINRLIKKIEANKLTLGTQLNPADLKAVNEQLEQARQAIKERNPFLALKESLAEVRLAMNEKKLLSDKSDPLLQELEERKKLYKAIAEQLADPATAPTVAIDYKSTLQEGTDFADYLKKRIEKLQGLKIKLGAEFTGQHELDVLTATLNNVQNAGHDLGHALKDTFADAGSTIQFISGCFDAAVSGMKKMGVEMDEDTETILGDIGEIMTAAKTLAEGIATTNPLGVIQGSITLFSAVFDIFNSKDRNAQKSIEKHEEALGRLKNVYNELSHAISKALGEEVYQNQTAMIGNLRAQQAELIGMMNDERGKKNADTDKVDEWQEQYAELGRQISDMLDQITQSITQTSASDLAGNLQTALIDAFEGGEDAAKAFGDVADEVIKNAVANALKLQLLEKPLQNAIKQLQKDMGFDEEGNGAFDGLTESEQKRFKDAVAAAGANFQAAMEMYKDLFEQLDDSDPTTLSGAIKGASQESIDLLAGQTNAVRQNQVTQQALLRQHLLHLGNIDANVGIIAGRLLTILNTLTSPAGTSLRSQGITD